MDWNLLAGPAALALAASLAVAALWRAHTKADEQREQALTELRKAVAAWPAALDALTDVVLDEPPPGPPPRRRP